MTQISVDALTLVKLDKRFYDCLKYHGSVVDMKSCITPVCVYHLTSFLTQTCKTDNMTSDERFHKNTNILNSVRWSHAITYIKYTHGPMHTQTVSSLFQSAVFTGSSVKEKCKLILFHSPQSAVCVPSLPAVQVCAWVCIHTTNAHKPKHQHQNRFTTTTYCIFLWWLKLQISTVVVHGLTAMLI